MISVVMPTYNRAEMLAKVLPSYLQSPVVGEMLVVDDGSRDHTAQVVAAFATHDSRVKLIHHAANRGMTFARNTGISNATGDLVLFSEDDLALGAGSLTTLADHMTASGADIIAGRRIWMRLGESEAEALDRANKHRWPVVNARLMEHYSHAITLTDVESALVSATMLVRHQVLDKVRFADCYPGNAWREESDFQLTALEAGFRVFFCPHSVCYHYDRAAAGAGGNRLRSDLIYLYWIYKNNLTFLRRHRQYLKEHIPEALVFGSPLLASLVYLPYRTALLGFVEARRALHSRRSGA